MLFGASSRRSFVIVDKQCAIFTLTIVFLAANKWFSTIALLWDGRRFVFAERGRRNFSDHRIGLP